MNDVVSSNTQYPTVKKAWKQLKGALKQAATKKKEAVQKGIKGFFNRMGHGAANKLKSVHNKFNQAVKPVKLVSRAAVNTFAAAAGYVVQKSVKGYNATKAGMDKFATGVKRVGLVSWRKTVEVAKKIDDARVASEIELKKKRRAAIRNVATKAKDLKDRAAYNTKSFSDRFGKTNAERTKTLIEKFKIASKPIKKTGKFAVNVVAYAVGWHVGTMSTMKKVLSKCWKRDRQTILSGYQKAQKFTKHVGSVAKQKALDLKGKAVSYNNAVKEGIHRYKAACKFVACKIAQDYKNGAKTVYMGGKNLGKSLVRGIAQGKNKVANTFSALRKSVTKGISNMKNNIKTSIKNRASQDTIAVYRAAKIKASRI